jgi:lipid-A-disaccharide synthase
LTKILMTCGETSGDHHSALVVRELRRLDPESEVIALGGEEMAAAGAHVAYPIDRFAFMGFSEILSGLPRVLSLEKALKNLLRSGEIDLFMPVDYPGLNLRLARFARQYNVPVLYYISPQIWAWGGWRINKMRSAIDLMAVILPFEEELYRKAGIPVFFAGHPCVGEIPAPASPKEAPGREETFTVLLFPGSRRQEVERMLPAMIGAARILRRSYRGIRFVLGRAPLIGEGKIEVPPDLVEAFEITRNGIERLNEASLVIAASGTVTLQSAVSGTPILVIYKTSPLTYLIGKWLVRIPWIAMPNVLAGERIIPELLQGDATSERVASEAVSLLGDEDRFRRTSRKLLRLRDALSVQRGPGLVAEVALGMAGGKSAEEILRSPGERRYSMRAARGVKRESGEDSVS